mgnify:CR=1 FL=1
MKKIVLLLAAICISAFAAKNIEVYTYHNFAPFITGKNTGLSYDLVKQLNDNSKEDMTFTLKIMPRSEINVELKPWISKECRKGATCNKDWMLLWVNHKWGFGRNALKTFSWTPLFKDSNSIVSSKETKFEYNKPQSVFGKKLLGVKGHKYKNFDRLVKNKKLTRIDGTSERDNLIKVQNNEGDFTIIGTSSLKYLQKENASLQDLHISKNLHHEYRRYIMTTPDNKELVDFIKAQNVEAFVNAQL